MNKPSEEDANEESVENEAYMRSPVKQCGDWEEFKAHIVTLNRICGHEIPVDDSGSGSREKPLKIFRGSGDALWRLETTLERATNNLGIYSYYNELHKVKGNLSTCLETSIPAFPDNIDEMTLLEDCANANPPALDFLAFLRHNSFPSPLLDWTKSPYIAAYFAFADCLPKTNVAIWAFLDFYGMGRQDPQVYIVDDPLSTSKRHFLQQSAYTICLSKETDINNFQSHEKYFREQDSPCHVLLKYILPGSERAKVLCELDTMNINAYSLFGSNEGLLKAIWNREHLSRDDR